MNSYKYTIQSLSKNVKKNRSTFFDREFIFFFMQKFQAPHYSSWTFFFLFLVGKFLAHFLTYCYHSLCLNFYKFIFALNNSAVSLHQPCRLVFPCWQWTIVTGAPCLHILLFPFTSTTWRQITSCHRHTFPTITSEPSSLRMSRLCCTYQSFAFVTTCTRIIVFR